MRVCVCRCVYACVPACLKDEERDAANENAREKNEVMKNESTDRLYMYSEFQF